MIPYILHVTVITTICFLFYKLLLQKETFYQLNRWTLLGCLAVSFSLPLLPVPRAWSWQDKWQEKEAASTAVEIKLATAPVASTAARLASVQIPASQQSLQPISRRPRAKRKHQASSRAVDDLRLPDQPAKHSADVAAVQPGPQRGAVVQPNPQGGAVVKPNPQEEAAMQTTGTATGTPVVKSDAPMTTGELVLLAVQWLFYCYLFGVVLFGANFLLQLAVLLYQSYSRPVIRGWSFPDRGGQR